MARRQRAQSWSHLPRPDFCQEETTEHLDERSTSRGIREASALKDGHVGGDAPDAAALGAKGNGNAVSGSSGSKVMTPVTTGEADGKAGACESGGDVDGVDNSEPVYPQRIVRRWPSSGDIGMLTDGR